MAMLDKNKLTNLYHHRGMSMQAIANLCSCSLHRIKYWMRKYGIKIRSRSDAAYLKKNPNGDPFSYKTPKSLEEAKLFGLGLGLYWGEGTKADTHSIRLGNTDPKLIKKFMEFLVRFFSIKKSDFRFGLQIFNDMSIEEVLDFWAKMLRIKRNQFYKPIITKSGSLGTYRKKSKYGVLTVMYHNTKLRNLLIKKLPM